MKKAIRLGLSILLVLILSSAFSFADTNTSNYNSTKIAYANATDNRDFEVVKRADSVTWRYKRINGQLYKRLYNISKNQWMGSWIKA